jgi:hypothetical protein
LGPHAYDPGNSRTGVFWTTPIPEHSVKVNLEKGSASLHLTNVPVFDFFTVQNSIDPVNPAGVAAATLNTLHVEWSDATAPQEYNDPASTFAGTFLKTAARISVVVTTSAVPAHGIPGFTFVSDDIIATFAEIGQEQNGAFYPGG